MRPLVSEGLVKPDPFTAADWVAWNAGYNVLLRVETLLNEVGAHVGRLIPGAVRKGVPGLSKQWLYFTWGTDTLDVGLGFAASPGGGPHGSPTVFSFVRNHGAELDSAIRAVGQTAATRDQWGEWPDTITWCGLHYSSPALSRSVGEVIEAEEFEAQVEQRRIHAGDRRVLPRPRVSSNCLTSTSKQATALVDGSYPADRGRLLARLGRASVFAEWVSLRGR